MMTSNTQKTIGTSTEMDKIEKWVLPIEENDEGEQIVTLPEDLLDTIGWDLGDELEWVVDDRGIILRKNETN